MYGPGPAQILRERNPAMDTQINKDAGFNENWKLQKGLVASPPPPSATVSNIPPPSGPGPSLPPPGLINSTSSAANSSLPPPGLVNPVAVPSASQNLVDIKSIVPLATDIDQLTKTMTDMKIGRMGNPVIWPNEGQRDKGIVITPQNLEVVLPMLNTKIPVPDTKANIPPLNTGQQNTFTQNTTSYLSILNSIDEEKLNRSKTKGKDLYTLEQLKKLSKELGLKLTGKPKGDYVDALINLIKKSRQT